MYQSTLGSDILQNFVSAPFLEGIGRKVSLLSTRRCLYIYVLICVSVHWSRFASSVKVQEHGYLNAWQHHSQQVQTSHSP